jgi:predicted flap endonuclease-1-like 5' DNA nuclease
MPSIDSIAGLGVKQATTLRKARIRTTEGLLKRGATRAGRKRLAKATGLSEELIMAWVNRADLMRVKGIGREYSDLLEATGVETVKELRTRKPANLHSRMVKVNDKKHLVRRLPTQEMVESWVAHASTLNSQVKY